jgi:hypothetical protein
MARALGIPTRLAIGWTWGSQDANGVWHVTDDDTHTWPEVYFPQIGWVAFEPTPSRGMPGAQAYTGVPAQQQGSPPISSATTPTTKPATATAPAPSTKRVPNADRSVSGGAGSSTHHHRPWWRAPLIVVATLVLLAAAWLLAVRSAARLRRAHRRIRLIGASSSGDPSTGDDVSLDRAKSGGEGSLVVPGGLLARFVRWLRDTGFLAPSDPVPTDEAVLVRAEVLLAWAETGDLLAWWGVRRRLNETYVEFAERAGAELRMPLSLDHDAERALSRLATAATKADYSRLGLTAGEGAAATAEAAAIRRALTESATAWQRARRIIDPRVAVGR